MTDAERGAGALRGRESVLLQICANDAAPFADICHYYEAAARALSWRPQTVMIESRAARREPAFHYLDSDFDAELAALLDAGHIVLTLCHRYRAYRHAMNSALLQEPLFVVAHEFGLLRRRQRRLQRHWDRLSGRPRVRFAGVSTAVTDELSGLGRRAVLLPNGIDLARADARRLSRPDALQALGLRPGPFHIGVVGRLHPKKNPLLAVEGFRLAAAELGDTRLTFVGSGQLEAEVTGRSEDLPVTLSGFVADAARCMAAFDLLLVPSGAQEAFGMVVLEAMAAGVPVLCGPSPGPLFVAGSAGRHFEPAAGPALAAALCSARSAYDDGSLGAEGAAGRRRVEDEFSVAAGARRLAALIDDTDSAPPAGAS